MSLSRIRVISELPAFGLKIWLPIPSTGTTKVEDLISIVSKMLGGIEIQLELDGMFFLFLWLCSGRKEGTDGWVV